MIHLSASPLATIIFMVCAGLLFGMLRRAAGLGGPPPPVAKPFLTARETAMLAVIERVLPEHRIHAQVAMGALLQVPRSIGRVATPADRNRFSQKIVDFVVQERASGRIVALIEVDDSTHDPDRDRDRDEMTGGAGYRTIRIARSARPTLADVRQALAPLFGTTNVPIRRLAAGAHTTSITGAGDGYH